MDCTDTGRKIDDVFCSSPSDRHEMTKQTNDITTAAALRLVTIHPVPIAPHRRPVHSYIRVDVFVMSYWRVNSSCRSSELR